jgi:hypothetical protein
MKTTISQWTFHRLVLLLLALGFVFGITCPKLVTSAQVNGWIPGATRTQGIVTRKGHYTRQGRLGFEWENHWIEFTEPGVPAPQQTNVRLDDWQQWQEGDVIEVVHIPGNPRRYVPNETFVDLGNFLFDIALLAIELTVVFVVLRQLLKARLPTKVPPSEDVS